MLRGFINASLRIKAFSIPSIRKHWCILSFWNAYLYLPPLLYFVLNGSIFIMHFTNSLFMLALNSYTRNALSVAVFLNFGQDMKLFPKAEFPVQILLAVLFQNQAIKTYSTTYYYTNTAIIFANVLLFLG